MSTIAEQITAKALELRAQKPEGMRYSELCRALLDTGQWKPNTIHGTIWDLHTRLAKQVSKPSKGLYRLTRFGPPVEPESPTVAEEKSRIKEEAFYKPFADWLVQQEECTQAIPLGGNKFKDKWGTPDVIGKRESRRTDIVHAPLEIISAEIKPDTTQLVTAFGQACAYCLFSHKSYLVIPKLASDSEKERLDALCQVFGVGFVFFDAENPDDPQFELRLRPRRQEPDMFYANKYMKMIETDLFT